MATSKMETTTIAFCTFMLCICVSQADSAENMDTIIGMISKLKKEVAELQQKSEKSEKRENKLEVRVSELQTGNKVLDKSMKRLDNKLNLEIKEEKKLEKRVSIAEGNVTHAVAEHKRIITSMNDLNDQENVNIVQLFRTAKGLRRLTPLRCTGEDNGCCTRATPCVVDEGDCDNDYECKGDLVCGSQCPWGDNDQCCNEPLCLERTTSGPVTGACCAFPFEWNGKSHNSCIHESSNGLWCSTTHKYEHSWGYCSGLNGDYRCAFQMGNAVASHASLKMGNRRGISCIESCIERKKQDAIYGYDINGVTVHMDTNEPGCWCQRNMTTRNTDTTYKSCKLDLPHLRCSGEDNGCCTKKTPCDVGEGDCDSKEECLGDLVCGHDNCPWGDRDDCCKKPTE